jgi:hypothetical protein
MRMGDLEPRGALFLLVALLTLGTSAPSAHANRALITEEALEMEPAKSIPPPEGEIEDACGLAPLFEEEGLYVSDYYHRLVEAFDVPLSPPPLPPHLFAFKSATLTGASPEGPCQLALDSNGSLYANLWHEGVVRLLPSFQVFDEGNSTGVAVDEEDDVYVLDRTHVVVYDPSGAKIGEIGSGGSLTDAYGIAVFGGRVYVPDAFENAIEVYEPKSSTTVPAFTISGNATPQHAFSSLIDGSVAVDPTNGHLLVLDNLQPGFEHPKAAIDEFTATGAFLGQLKHTVIDGEPSGLAVDATARLFVSSGNSERANVFAFGPYTESGTEAVGESIPEAGSSPAGGGDASIGGATIPAPVEISAPAHSAKRSVARRCGARKRSHGHRAHRRPRCAHG